MGPKLECPFCALLSDPASLLVERELASSFFDAFPLNPGHTLVIPRRHVADVWNLKRAELEQMLDVAMETRALVDERFVPDGYNLGVNVGEAAGQTVAHAHLHLIPRYEGDSGDPRGGIRWIFPERAAYWDKTPGDRTPGSF